MNIDLRRRRATLETLRRDLPRWSLGEDGQREVVPTPVVAIDWSEIFCYIMYEPPREEVSEELFAAHYAGLNYLLFRLRCRPVLLPPYKTEMTTFVEMLETRAIGPMRKTDFEQLTEKYEPLLRQIRDLQTQFPEEFGQVISGDLSAAERLPIKLWDFLESLLKDSIPTIYLDVQQTTLSAMQALGKWLKFKDEKGEKRMWYLGALNILPERACERSLGGWHDWNVEMDSQRPRLERQNRADALALAYLQGLHQASFWNDVPVYFASRSLSMLQVMENHAGEFEPYRRSDGDVKGAIQSSWRSWDYFAELGYYASEFRSHTTREGRRADIEQDLMARIAKLDQCISLASRGSKEDASFSGWETLRGSFDLEGMGAQDHWKRIRVQQPRVAKLIDVLSSVLSAEDSRAFVAKRAALAHSILSEIGSILGALPPDIQMLDLSEPHVDDEAAASLVRIVRDSLDMSALFAEYVEKTVNGDPHLIHSAVALLRNAAAADSATSMRSARELLRLMAEPSTTSSLSDAPRDWLVGVAFFFRTFFDESLKYLSSWLETQNGFPTLALVTRALCAEACRSGRDREYDLGMRFLLNVHPEELSSLIEVVVWHCLTGQLLLEWMAHAKEHFEIYPKPGGQSGESAILMPMVDPVLEFLKRSDSSHPALCVRSASTVLMLAGRYIPENLPYLTEPEQKRKIAWLLDNTRKFAEIERWFRLEAEREHSSRHFHTLGYYNLKMALVDQRSHGDEAVSLLKEAERLAEKDGDRRIQRLVAEHLAWAEDNLEGRP